MAISVQVPKDLSGIKTKVALNLTKRQIICFSGAAVTGIPLYFLTKGLIGTSAASLLMMGAMLPFFFLQCMRKMAFRRRRFYTSCSGRRYSRRESDRTGQKTSTSSWRRKKNYEGRFVILKKKQKAETKSRRKSSGGLTFSEKKRLVELKHILSGKGKEKEKPTTAQKTITFEKMFRDGICQVSHHYYTKMVEFFDINYSLLEVDEQADILAQYSKLINYFDPSVKFELVLFNLQVNEQVLTEQFDIPWQEDDFNDIREEYTEMLKKQAAKGNNGIIKSKYLIFGVESNGYKEAKSRLNNIEKDVIRNLSNIGTLARGLDGKERLRILHEYFNQDTMEPFRFSFKDLAESGKSVKDYIAPPGFDFRYPNRFKSGNMYGCVSYLDIITPKFTDELIKQLLDIDANLTISMHMQTEDPVKAIKKLKAVIFNIQKMKIEEQKKQYEAAMIWIFYRRI